MKKFIIITLSLLAFASCEIVDILDKKPPYQADLSGAITDQKTVELALMGTYLQLPSTGMGVQFPLCAGSFSAGTLERQSFYTSGNAIYYSERYWPSLTWLTDPEWDNCYALLKNANFLIDAIENKIDNNEFTGTRRDEILGELHMLKGLSYLRLLMRYGQFWDLTSPLGLILREELPSLGSILKPRSSVIDSYNLILQNLDFAIKKAPKYVSSVKASSLAAKALKTKVFFMMNNYKAADSMANIVLEEAYIEGSYSDVFNKALDSKEILFGRFFGKTEAEATSVRLSAFGEGKWGPSASFLSILNDDPRYSAIVKDGISITWNTKTYTNLKSVKKYLNSQNNMPIIFIRSAEILLIKAESIFRANGSIADSYEPIKKLRMRAGASVVEPTNRKELAEAIFNEWIIEMSFENWHEWFACLRFDKLLDLNSTLKKALADEYSKGQDVGDAYLQRIRDRRIMPIPASEINSNPVTQNPGY